jgi:lactoylglutathione lyase
MITGIAHVGIRVHDLARSRVFYELLGWKFVAGPIGPEPVALLHHATGVEINLILNAPEASVPNPLMDVPHKLPGYTHIALFVDDLDGVCALLESNGFPITERANFPGGVRAAFVRDPDGNVLEFDEKT